LGPIGLHFSEEQLHAVQLRQASDGQLNLQGWASMPYPEPRNEIMNNAERLKLFCRQILKRGKFSGTNVVTVMAPDKMKLTSLKYSVSEGTPEGRTILRLMSDRLVGELDDYVIDYLPIQSQASKTERVAMVATCRREDVVAYLDALSMAGLDVEALEISPAAISRLIGAIPSPEGPRNTMVINFGSEKSYITVISGRNLLLDHEVDFGEFTLIRHICKSLDLSVDLAMQLAIQQGLYNTWRMPVSAGDGRSVSEPNTIVELVTPLFGRLVDDIRRSNRYAASETKGGAIEQVYTFGSIARWPGADELISRMAKIPVADILPLEELFGTKDGKTDLNNAGIGPDLAVAAGLALRGMVPNE
jgi:Tfp pilus assembly PilM family ATPase